jgi:hypothetical protein
MSFSLPLTMKCAPKEEDSSPCEMRSLADKSRRLHRILCPSTSAMEIRYISEPAHPRHDWQKSTFFQLLTFLARTVFGRDLPSYSNSQSRLISR